jgi:hypothetical protein
VLRPGSIAATLADRVPILDHDRPLLPQLRGATICAAEMSSMLTSRAGRAANELRDTMYRLLGIDPPPWPVRPSPIPLPQPKQWR